MDPRGRILIVDDEETFLSSTADLLRREGYQCVTAADADTAARHLEQVDFDLVISDVEMPGNEDLALVRNAAATAPGVPLVVMTGLPSAATALKAIDLAVDHYLLKPFEFPRLLECVVKAIAVGRQRRAVTAFQRGLEQWRRLRASGLADMLHSTHEGNEDRSKGRAAAEAVYSSMAGLDQSGSAGRFSFDRPCGAVPCRRKQELEDILRRVVELLDPQREPDRRSLTHLRGDVLSLLETAV